MLFVLLLLVLGGFLLTYYVLKTTEKDVNKTTSNHVVESKPKKSDAYLDLDNFDNVDHFSELFYVYVKQLVNTYGLKISTREPINYLHNCLEEIVGHLNKQSNFTFKKYYVEGAYLSQQKPTDVFYTNVNESISTYRYHLVKELIPQLFMSKNSLKLNAIDMYVISKESNLQYLWDKLTDRCDSDNAFNDRYSSASILCALGLVLTIHHVIKNHLKRNHVEILDDHLTTLEIELDIGKAPKVCDNTLYCPENGLQVNSHTISKILNIF